MTDKPIVYVNRITNLSDARYCAGMNVDILGFVTSPGHEDYISPIKYQEMSGWISGPRRAVEITDATGVNWRDILEQYRPDLVHVAAQYVSTGLDSGLPLIVEIPHQQLGSFRPSDQLRTRIEYLLITTFPPGDFLGHGAGYSLLLALEKNDSDVGELLGKTGAKGFGLRGTPELAPGLKDYDHLSRILEELDR